VLKIKESTSDATVSTPPIIAQNLENNQTQVIPTHHTTHVVKKCANGLCFSVCTTLIGDTSIARNSPGLCIVSKWGFNLPGVRTRQSIEPMSRLNALIVSDMGLLADIANKRGDAVLVRVDLQSMVLRNLLRIQVGRERVESVELCANDFDEVLEHILVFRMRRGLQWERVISLVENLRAIYTLFHFAKCRDIPSSGLESTPSRLRMRSATTTLDALYSSSDSIRK